MSTMRELKRRIKSITSTQQLTQAMKMVAVSKYNRALSRLSAFRPYQAQCEHLQQTLGGLGQSLAPVREPKHVTYVVLTGNRGLCGDYNQQILRCLRQQLARETLPHTILMCGRWGAENAPDLTMERVTLSDIPTWDESNTLADRLIEDLQQGRTDRVYVVYQQFRNILSQEPVCEQLLPFASNEESANVGTDYLYVPDRQTLLDTLAKQCFYARVYERLLAAATGMQGSMMMTMRTASDNSAAMIESLSLTLNRLRQSSVTTQVLEIASSSLQEEEET